MDARKHLIIIKGKDQTDSVASFQFHDGKCEVVYTSAPNKSYSFQRSNVEILPLQKKIDPARVIVTVNGQTISGIDEILDFSGYYRIVRNGKRDLSFRRSEVQFQQNCLTDGKNQETFQYFKETAAAISLVAENGINILSMQYDKIQQVSEDTVLASYLAPQKDVKMPQMPEAVIYPFGLNQSQKLAVERALSSKISIIQGPPGTGKTQTILNIIANVVRSGKTVAVVSNNNSATHNVVEKLEKKNSAFLTAFLGSLANKERFLDAQTGAYPNMSDWEMPPEEQQQLDRETTALSKELNEILNAKNRIAEIEQEFLRLNPEQHYFEEYYASYSDVPMDSMDKLPSQKLLALWMEFEQHAERETRLGLLQKISIMFRFNRNALKLFIRSPEQVIPYLQNQFYLVKRRELEAEKQELNRKLEHYAFDAKMDELTQKSLRLFRAELATRYHWRNNRRCFEKNDFRRNSAEFTREYPVVLSTTYSIKGTLSIEHIYEDDLEEVFTLFPRLKERRNQLAWSLSGGEQQMLAIGRALMARPKVLLLDEPSMGLSPVLTAEVFEKIQEINKNGMTVLLIEQNAKQAMKISDYTYVIVRGTNGIFGESALLQNDPQIVNAYLGKFQEKDTTI